MSGHFVTNGLVGHWHAAKATGSGPGTNSPAIGAWSDISGAVHHGALATFAYTTASGWAGSGVLADPYCLAFDGTSDIVSVGNLTAAETKIYSYEAWVKIPSGTSIYHAVGEGQTTSSTGAMATLGVGSAHKARFTLVSDANVTAAIDGTITIDNGAWHHVVGTCDGSNLRLYVDGSADGGPTSISSLGSVTLTTAHIGGRQRSTLSYWPGSIAVVRIYGRALTAAEVTQNYQAGLLDTGALPLPTGPDPEWRKHLSLVVTARPTNDPQNLVPNPNFANQGLDGWWPDSGLVATWSNVTTPALPSGLTAKMDLVPQGATGNFSVGYPGGTGCLISVTASQTYAFSANIYNAHSLTVTGNVDWYDSHGTFISTTTGVGDAFTGGASAFIWCSRVHTAPSGATMCQPKISVTGSSSYAVHVTGVMFCASPDKMVASQYCDGDMAGYQWEGARHNSYTLFAPTRSWDITREAQDIDFTTKVPGGFSKLSFLVARSVQRTYDDLARLVDVKLSLSGSSLFEGFIHSVEPELADEQKIRVTCHGHWAKYAFDQTWRGIFRDTSIAAWKGDQTNDQAGIYYHDKADRLHIRIAEGIVAPDQSSHRLYYWLFDGIPRGDRITEVSFTYAYSLDDGYWVTELLGYDSPDDATGQLVWSNGGTSSGSGTRDITLTSPCRCLVLRLRRTNTKITTGQDNYIKLTNVAVYASPTTARVDTIVSAIADDLAPSLNVPAKLTYTVDHAAFRHHSSRAQAIHSLCHYVDGEYDYAVWEDGMFCANDRPDGAAIPEGQTIVVHADTPGMAWNVRNDYDKAYDGVTVRFKLPDKGPQNELVELTRPVGGYTRIKTLSLTTVRHMSTTMALQEANRFLRHWQAGTERGEVILAGNVLTKSGVVLPAVRLRAGMWIENLSLPNHRPLFISKVQTRLDSGEVTLRINDGDRRHAKHVMRLLEKRGHGAID